jgi:hypothetical protein
MENELTRNFAKKRIEENEEHFKKKLKYLYKKIDTASNLLWSHECHLTGSFKKRLRSKDDNPNDIFEWKNKATQQTGYGEIAMV